MTPDDEMQDSSPAGSRRWRRYIISLILLVLIVWGGFRACSDSGVMNPDRPFVLAQQRIPSNIWIAGKERNAEAFFKDLIFRIAENEGFRVRVITVGSDLAFLGLDARDYDGVISTLSPDARTMRRYAFSDPLYRVGSVLIVRSDSNVHSLNDMEGRIIGIPRESSTFFDIGVYPDLIFYSYDDEIDSLEDLERGQLDGVIMNAWQAYVLTQGLFNGKLRVATDPFTDDGIRVVTLRGSRFASVLPRFDKGLEKLRNDGTFEDLLNKWGLVSTDVWQGEHEQLEKENQSQ